MTTSTDAALLAKGLADLGVTISKAQQQQLLDFVALLGKWNRAYNLTSVRNSRDMVIRHLLDSLAILPYIEAGGLLDVGTGAGIPGLILAICLPNQPFTLLDSNGKKTRFIRQAMMELDLPNVTVVQERAEQYLGSFHQLCCRAFAALPDIVAVCDHLLAPQGRLLAMKSHLEAEEQNIIGWQQQTIELVVPELHATRQLLVLTREGEQT